MKIKDKFEEMISENLELILMIILMVGGSSLLLFVMYSITEGTYK